MPSQRPPRIAVAPSPAPEWVVEAVRQGGGHVVDPPQAEALIWIDPRNPYGLEDALAAHPAITWVQLCDAGVEQFSHLFDEERVWTCAKGVYSEPVAELALTLGLSGLRGIGHYAREATWSGPRGRNLHDGRVTVIGGGGITEALVRMLRPFDCHITVVRNRVQEMDGVDEVLEADRYVDALSGVDLVVLALALTPDTEGLIGRGELEAMEGHAWLVNVGRGRHVVTTDLVDALEAGTIGGAGLDVTDPEPLPAGHPLWSLGNCVITPHVGITPEMTRPLLGRRIEANVRRFAAHEDLLGVIDPDLGY